MLLPYPHPPHRIPTLLPRRSVHRKGVPALLRPTHFQPWVYFDPQTSELAPCRAISSFSTVSWKGRVSSPVT